MTQIKTKRGCFNLDRSGVWHYEHCSGGHVTEAAGDAIKHRPASAAWFWFNVTPTPMILGDTARTLSERWKFWRNRYDHDPAELLRQLATFSHGGDGEQI